MSINRTSIFKIAGITLVIILLGGMFSLRIMQNRNTDHLNTNFFFFWLAGRMELTGQNPYNQTQYLAGHDASGVTSKPIREYTPTLMPTSWIMAAMAATAIRHSNRIDI